MSICFPEAKTLDQVPAGRLLVRAALSLPGKETVTKPAAGTRRLEAGDAGAPLWTAADKTLSVSFRVRATAGEWW